MTAATPLLIQSPTKQAVLSPTSAHFHVQTIKHPHEQPYAPRSPRNTHESQSTTQHNPHNNIQYNIPHRHVKQSPLNTVQIPLKCKPNVNQI